MNVESEVGAWSDQSARRETRLGLRGMVSDASRGTEPTPVMLMDDADFPAGFEYVASNVWATPSAPRDDDVGCSCPPGVPCDPTTCACCRNADGLPAYDAEGLLRLGVSIPADDDYDDDDDDDDGRGFAFFRECGPSCRCSRDCPNRASTRGVSVRLSIRPTSCGLGVFAEEPIVAGRRVCGYFGEVVSAEEAARRVAASDARPGASHYVLAVRRAPADDAEDRGDVSWIDPTTRGNVGRWLNHSCDGGNLTTVLTRSAGESASRVVFHARRDIASGTELRWRYGKPRGEGEGGEGGRRCACGTSACRGWMPFDDHGER